MIFKKLVLVTIFVLLHSAAWAIPPIPEIPAFPSIQSNGKTYHVDKDTGNNTTGNGSSSSPWATIQYGVNHLSTGDTLIVHEAATAYAEDIDIDTSSGTSTNWITIQGAAGDNVVISGSGGSYCVEIQNSVSYIYLKNLNIDHTQNTGIYLKPGVSHIVLEDIDVDGNDTGNLGIRNGKSGSGSGNAGADHVYYKNVTAHDHINRGFYLLAKSHDVVYDNCIARNNGSDGFGGNLAAPGDTYAAIGLPDDPNNVCYNIYYTNCQSYNNAGDGYDIGLVKQKHIFKNCVSRDNGPNQGNAFKVWGDEVWLVNCLAYDNKYSGVAAKPLWDQNLYILNCTFVGNSVGLSGGEINCIDVNAERQLASLNLYLSHVIIQAVNTRCLRFRSNTTLKEEDYNCYYNSSGFAVAIEDFNHSSDYTINDIANGIWYSKEGFGQHDIAKKLSDGLSDPGFSDLASDDYRLTGNSLAVNAGMNIGINDDIIGTKRPQGDKIDIGAFEYLVRKVLEPPKNLSSTVLK